MAWGDTSSALNANGSKALPGAWAVGPDARGGNQPWDTMIVGNIAHEIGLFQKQSSLCVLYLYLPVVFLPVALYEATATQVTWTCMLVLLLLVVPQLLPSDRRSFSDPRKRVF